MRTQLKRLTIAAVVASLASCGGENQTRSQEASTAQIPEPASAPAANADEPRERSDGPAGRTTFEFAITGEGLDLPIVRGGMVMAMDGGPMGLKYMFVSTDADETVITLRGAGKDEPGTFDPENVSIGFPEQDLLCDYLSRNTPGQLELRIEKTAGGIRGELSGALSCRPRTGAGDPVGASVEGWFER